MQCITSILTFNVAIAGIRLPFFQRSIARGSLNNVRKQYFGKCSASKPIKPFAMTSNSPCCKMNPSALVLLTDGAEELEFVTVVDVLRRGFVRVTIGGVCGEGLVKCRSDTRICPDKSLQDAISSGPYNVVVLPGGIDCAKTLCESIEVGKLLRTQECENGFIAAICAAPLALKTHSIGKGKCITSYPAMATELKKDDIYQYKDMCPVVVDGKLITSRGPATAFIFALTILEQLRGKKVAKEVASAMLYEY